jgi:hypothetical protein
MREELELNRQHWGLPKSQPQLPLMFSLRASKRKT